MIDVVHSVLEFNAGRDPERLRMKYEAMRKSPFVFLRGSCHRFYERLAPGALPASPLGWVCGDLHLENFGSFKGDNGLVYFDINDFDESALAPDPPGTWCASWPVCALGAATTCSLRRREAQQAVPRLPRRLRRDAGAGRGAVDRARHGRRPGGCAAARPARAQARGLSRRAHTGSSAWKARERRIRRRKLRTDGKKALPASREQRDRVTEAIRAFADDTTGSGLLRACSTWRGASPAPAAWAWSGYVILVDGKGSPGGNGLLDLKQVNASSLLPQLKKTAQPAWKNEAERAVALQQRVQAVSAGLLQPLRMRPGARSCCATCSLRKTA